MSENKESAVQKAFKDLLTDESLKIFNDASHKPFSEQAVFFLNAFWQEYGKEAEFIYAVSHKIFQMADMHAKGIQLIHLYNEGDDLDFDMGLYFFEKLCKFYEEPANQQFKNLGLNTWYVKNPNFRSEYLLSVPEMMTSIVRKKELRDKVDVNFDGRVSFLEFLLYQYKASPKDLLDRSMNTDEHPEIAKARAALNEVRKAVNEYEAEKTRLMEESKLPGVKGLKAKNLLAQINSSPAWDRLNKALITAEAAVRIAAKKYGGNANLNNNDNKGAQQIRTDGAIWWMQRELREQQEKYGVKKSEQKSG